MPVPIGCLDRRLRQFLTAFRRASASRSTRTLRASWSRCCCATERRTLSGLLRQVAERRSVAGLSRFLARPRGRRRRWRRRGGPGSRRPCGRRWPRRNGSNGRRWPLRPGRPRATVVTGYLIGDDSTLAKPRGKQMEGVGLHHSTTAGARVPGAGRVRAGLYRVEGRSCPLLPLLYRQQAVCAAAGVPFPNNSLSGKS